MDDAPDNPDLKYAMPAADGWGVAEARSNPVREKSFDFALSVIQLSRALTDDHEYVISKQLLRSGTSIGALVEEAAGAESRKDFLHKMSIAHKEAREAHYWLRLLDASDLLPGRELDDYIAKADELVRLLTAITGSVKKSTRK